MNKSQKIQQIKAEAVAEAIAWGLPADTFNVVWDESPLRRNQTTRYSIPAAVKKDATSQQLSFWNRHIEGAGGEKPKTIQELDARITTYLRKQSELGYAHLFPTPNVDDLAKRYDTIRNAPLAEAADYPPDWQAIRALSAQQLRYSLEAHTRRLTEMRAEALKATADYLLEEMKNGSYRPAEVAEIIAWSVKYKIDFDSHGRPKTVKINQTNEHIPTVISGKIARQTITSMRGEGGNPLPVADALMDALVATRKAIAAARSDETGWVTYEQSGAERDAEVLSQAVAASPWCTGAGTGAAQIHLRGGQFYVYFESGLPQVAIRTQNNRIAEIRGIGTGQKIVEERHREIAEDFILSGLGPSGGEDYLHDQNLRRALADFAVSGVATSQIFLMLDQNGNLIEDKARARVGGYGQSILEDEYLDPIKKKTWDNSDLVEMLPDGKLRLKTNFVGKLDEIPAYHKIDGDLKLAANYPRQIPLLEEAASIKIVAIGRSLEEDVSFTISFPNLRQTSDITLPNKAQLGTGGKCLLEIPQATRVDKINAEGWEVIASSMTHCKSITAQLADLKSLEEIDNVLIAGAGEFPKLRKAGNLTISGDITAPELREVVKLSTRGEKDITLPNLTKAEVIYAPGTKDFSAEALKISRMIQLPLATKVHMPALESIDILDMFQVGEVSLPAIRTLHALRAGEATKVDLPNLLKAERIEADIATEVNINNCQQVRAIFAPLAEVNQDGRQILTQFSADVPQKETESPEWDAKTDGYQIWLNAASIQPGGAKGKIHHELAHLALADLDVQHALDALFKALPKAEQKEILAHNKGNYPKGEQTEERRAKTFEILSTKSSKSLLSKFVNAVMTAWKRVTGKETLPPGREAELLSLVLERGLEKIREREQTKKVEECFDLA